jgi:hypothetical protein
MYAAIEWGIEDESRFYAAEMVMGLEELHSLNIVYRLVYLDQSHIHPFTTSNVSFFPPPLSTI